MSETREDIVVLIPSHGLEDFPTELGEGPASSLLNSFAAAWHPALLAAKKSIPTWERADEPPSDIGWEILGNDRDGYNWTDHRDPKLAYRVFLAKLKKARLDGVTLLYKLWLEPGGA